MEFPSNYVNRKAELLLRSSKKYIKYYYFLIKY